MVPTKTKREAATNNIIVVSATPASGRPLRVALLVADPVAPAARTGEVLRTKVAKDAMAAVILLALILLNNAGLLIFCQYRKITEFRFFCLV